MTSILLQYGADVNGRSFNGQSPLHSYCSRDEVANLQYLLDGHVVHMDLLDNHGNNILHCSAVKGAECMSFIFKHYLHMFDVNALNLYGCSALHTAAICENFDAVK